MPRDARVYLRHHIRLCISLLFLLASSLPSACSNSEDNLSKVRPGLSRAEVVALLGEPDEMNVSTLPEGGFFGPQENLLSVIPAGASYEEWVYDIGEDNFYVWFAGEGKAVNEWAVILTGRYPKDAVW